MKFYSIFWYTETKSWCVAIMLCLSVLVLDSCGNRFIRNTEARDDAREMQLAIIANEKIENSITAAIETKPVYSEGIDDDTADDPAIWYNDVNPELSIIFGSNKKYGIHSYDLDGNEKQYIDCGTVNNIDIRKNVNFQKGSFDVLAGSHRFNNSIVLFIISDTGGINNKAEFEISLTAFDPYGFCLHKDSEGRLFAFVNNKFGMIYQVAIDIDINNNLISDVVNQFKLKTQVEGMVVDDNKSILYVGEEQTGIYSFDLNQKKPKGKLLSQSTNSNKFIRYDIEGLALINSHYLVASIQGSFSYAVFDLIKGGYIKSFKIDDGRYDRVEETDGLEINTQSFGDKFPEGILVVQDGFNFDDENKQAQNFKIIDLRKVTELFIKTN